MWWSPLVVCLSHQLDYNHLLEKVMEVIKFRSCSWITAKSNKTSSFPFYVLRVHPLLRIKMAVELAIAVEFFMLCFSCLLLCCLFFFWACSYWDGMCGSFISLMSGWDFLSVLMLNAVHILWVISTFSFCYNTLFGLLKNHFLQFNFQ